MPALDNWFANALFSGRKGTSTSPQPSAASRALPVIMYSDPPKGFHLQVLLTASRCNPGKVYYITHCNELAKAGISAQHHTAFHCRQVRPHSESEDIVRLHPGPPPKHPNSKQFEMASIVRWAHVGHLAKEERFDRFLFVDCDVMVFSTFSTSLSHTFNMYDSLTQGRNGAVSIWSYAGIRSFVDFLVLMMHACSQRSLSKSWSVDMSLIGLWQSVQLSNKSLVIPDCNMTLRSANMRVAHFPFASAAGYFIGAVNGDFKMANVTQSVKSCDGNDGMRTRVHLVKHPNARFGKVAIISAYDLHMCSPYVMDTCSQTLVPVHAAHYTGRYKAFLGSKALMGQNSRCDCVTKSISISPSHFAAARDGSRKVFE
mmetsp:Transcript_27271/g.67673  ORF Transcript_27271/g.67673 Transcript_27271/m.67673 type:complete len:371 (+) Transcript_27271:10-1122(+)